MGYVVIRKTDHPRAGASGYIGEHVLVAEKAMDRLMPSGAQVHHVNGHRHDNRPQNLVVCQDRAYHALLHRRADALRESGHADWLRCSVCSQHDAPANLMIIGDHQRHRACWAAYMRERREKRRAADVS